ncbi:hypothetical protein ASD24_24710 [Paenibacillus sp. Root52]|uniref:hypothetical protein n=1 Tax=Paenibacillus sp. Root52 TaxID=1736552 RepID=UPI0006F6F3F1|nr:hypothetical protein [Paenibacillus sp. Root52]KQY91000.1 hypothetical protein ASD24_24710 [Paenibacillus sp. Root52]
MARFRKGQSFKGQRVHVANVFEQTGKGMTGKNVAFSISNDTREGDDIFTDPMLVYDKYIDNEGKEKPTFTAEYSAKQWEAIEAAANKDGDNLVIEADLFMNRNGKGLLVNTNTLKTPEVPFNSEQHKSNTLAARALKKEVRVEQESEKQSETELSL